MNRITRGLCSVVLVGTLLLSLLGDTMSVTAAVDAGTRLSDAVVFYIDSPVAMIRNTMVRIDDVSTAVRPVTEAGRTLLPVRFLAESLGASVQWLAPEKTAVITSADSLIRITLDTFSMEVNGVPVPLDVPARITDSRILVPMRAISEALGQEVDWYPGGLIVVSNTQNLLDAKGDATALQQLATRFGDPITYRKADIKTASGTRSVHVTRIRPDDPRIRFEVALPQTKLSQTADFTETAKAKGAKVAINGNFFNAYSDIKDPIGHVMIDGELVYGQSGITSSGITRDKKIFFGQPGIFTQLFADGKRVNEMSKGVMTAYNHWTAYEVNTMSQSAGNAIVYTPRRGTEIGFKAAGDAITVRGGKVAAVTAVAPGSKLPIPADGYVVFFGSSVSKDWADIWRPAIGRSMELENYLFKNPGDAFTLEGMQWMLSGGPDLVVNSTVAPVSTSLTFSGERFTTMVAPRTAIGLTAEGHLLLVSTAAAKISDMKEIMMSLGCTQAVNLDGGGSTGLYYSGTTILKPGRLLATMFFVYE